MTDKTVIITGASQGIGAGLANRFLERGYNVVATSRRVTQSAEISASERLARVDGDIAEPETAKAVVETALARFGSIDALVNNAGIFFTKPFIDYAIEDYRCLAATNLEGFLHLTQRVVRQMLVQKRGGSIVSITTPMVDHPIAGVKASVAMLTKGGIEAMSKNIAMEYAKERTRANTVAPGVVDTPLHKDNPKEFLKTLSPMNGVSSVKEIVDAVLFLTEAPHRGAADNRGGAARRRRRASGKMVTQLSAQASAETAKIRLTRKSAAYWVATFNNPPLNIVREPL
jgi:NAD(P)-dependent dehydrogenase (short-subunit alcohol dehydrogenase family)